MKKSLLGLLIALLTFFGGVFAAKIYLVKYQFISVPPIEAVKVEGKVNKAEYFISNDKEEVKTEDLPANKYIGGWYNLENYKAIKDVHLISLDSDWADENNEKMITSATVFGGKEFGDKLFESVWAEIDQEQVKFRTKKIKGVSYRFEGTFFKNKTSGEDGEKVLRGTLQKYIKDKKVAEVSGDFAYYEPRCWH